MKKHLIGLLFFKVFIVSILCAQQTSLAKYWVAFSDKDNTPFCTCRPAEFLSARALERRDKSGIPITENDLPVDPRYVQVLRERGALVHNVSKWLNAAAVVADSVTVADIASLPFVQKVAPLGKHIAVKNPPNRPSRKRVPLAEVPSAGDGSNELGYAALQNSLLNMPLLYWAGARGSGIWIGVMDGGFTKVDTLPFFDSIALQHRLFQVRDFVERDTAVFESAYHGTAVLSVMAANMPGYFVGTAPDATYFLFKTEDTGGEFPIEEANWVAAAEMADSMGIDVLNASLGYTVFNDTTLGHFKHELDGQTAIGSRGAAIAAQKGMIICNSAGNSGDEDWQTIGVPADAPGVIAVGALTHDGARASFSSLGPSADGRIKPDLSAPGEMVVGAGTGGIDLGLSNGTSMASPILAGAIASLWSAYPDKTAAEILDALFQAADQASKPDNERGYGQPDMARAWLSLGGFIAGENSVNDAGNGLFAFDRDQGRLQLLFFQPLVADNLQIHLSDILGERYPPATVQYKIRNVSTITLDGLYRIPPGTYFVVIQTENKTYRLKCHLAR